MAKLNAGDIAPDFTLVDTYEKTVSLADFAGSRVVLYFYPAAMTPGCTIEANDFNASISQFTAAGYQILGVSPDQPAKLAKFRDREGLSFTLLADPEREVLNSYGAYGTKVLYGKKMEGVIRSTFVIDVDTDGVGMIAEARYNVKATGHVARLVKDLGLEGVA
ncbi:MAG TPA: thioredoxin-dependent thiol peroxidase [Propionicimonas sp.]|nr:thioredoxin-dependent thiol peroxidase [Propionicimonas sp.]